MRDNSFSKKIAHIQRRKIAANKVVQLEAYRQADAVLHHKEEKAVLIVDDDDVVRQAFKRVLAKEKYRVYMAKDGLELSSVLAETKLDLIFLDTALPWVSGIEICSLIKSHPTLKKVPVVLLSTAKDAENIQNSFSAGADEYLTKPLRMEQLLKVVSTWLG